MSISHHSNRMFSIVFNQKSRNKLILIPLKSIRWNHSNSCNSFNSLQKLKMQDQSLPAVETLVVQDGETAMTKSALKKLEKERLKEEKKAATAARLVGILQTVQAQEKAQRDSADVRNGMKLSGCQ